MSAQSKHEPLSYSTIRMLENKLEDLGIHVLTFRFERSKLGSILEVMVDFKKLRLKLLSLQ